MTSGLILSRSIPPASQTVNSIALWCYIHIRSTPYAKNIVSYFLNIFVNTHYYLRQGNYAQPVSVCLSVCLSGYLFSGLLKNYR